METSAALSKVSQAVHSHVPCGKQGDAYYSKMVKTAFKYHEETWPLVEKALDEILSNSKPEAPIVIANYGSSDGGVSLPLMGKIVRKVRQVSGKSKEILICYEDQPTNDFTGMFQILTGQIKIGKETSYLCEDDKVFATACGVSFYLQCFPSSSIDLALSATAFHWLKSPPPRKINDFWKYHEESEETASMMAKDWEMILLHRAAEMKTGGWMVLAELSRTEEGESSGRTKNIKMNVLKMFHDCWENIYDRNIITKAEYEKAVLASCFRSYNEHMKPFLDPHGKVMKSGLRLVSMETKLTRCAFHSDFVENPNMDPMEHARRYVGAMRAYSNYSFFAALSKERTTDERNNIVDKMYQRYEDVVASSPLDHGCDYLHRHILIRKINGGQE